MQHYSVSRMLFEDIWMYCCNETYSGTKGSLHPCGPKTAIEKTSWSARFVIAPKAPHFHSDGLAYSLRKQDNSDSSAVIVKELRH